MTPREIYLEFKNGASMGEIAARMNKTRSAVAGIIYRYRKAKGLVVRKPDSFQKPMEQRLKLPPIDVSSFLEVLEHNRCRYIEGDTRRGNATYCSHSASRNGFCEGHRAICYIPIKRRGG